MPSTLTSARAPRARPIFHVVDEPGFRFRVRAGELPFWINLIGRGAKPPQQRKAATPKENNPSKPKPLPVPPLRSRQPEPINARRDASKPKFAHLMAAAVPYEPAAPTPVAPAQPSAKAIARQIRAGSAEATRPMRVQRPAEDTLAGRIIAAAEKARSKTRALLPPVGSAARQIIDAGRKRRGEI
jgi:hypothetical protein